MSQTLNSAIPIEFVLVSKRKIYNCKKIMLNAKLELQIKSYVTNFFALIRFTRLGSRFTRGSRGF